MLQSEEILKAGYLSRDTWVGGHCARPVTRSQHPVKRSSLFGGNHAVFGYVNRAWMTKQHNGRMLIFILSASDAIVNATKDALWMDALEAKIADDEYHPEITVYLDLPCVKKINKQVPAGISGIRTQHWKVFWAFYVCALWNFDNKIKDKASTNLCENFTQ